MRKYIFAIAVVFTCVMSSSCGSKYSDLFSITDEFVESLQTTYESYGLLGGTDKTKYTKDGEYKVFPLGRLINVRIERAASDEEYENLQKILQKHYAKDTRVNDVYRCQAGTLMIDCRN